MKSADFNNCEGLGAFDELVLKEGMQSVNFEGCTGLTGTVDKIVLPVGMQEVDFSYCPDLTGAIDTFVLPVGMQSVKFVKCTGLTGDVDTFIGAMPSYTYEDCVAAGGGVWRGIPAMKIVDFSRCSGLTGDLTQMQIPGSLIFLSLSGCEGLTGMYRRKE